MPNKYGVDKETKCEKVPECFKHSRTQLFAVSNYLPILTLDSVLLIISVSERLQTGATAGLCG